MQLQAVFFDFDGVIVDSAPIKTEAFSCMFRKYGPAVEKKVVDYHLAHQGISRFDKFRHAYDEILTIPINQDKLSDLGRQFSEIVLEKVIAAPYIPGIIENLNDLKSSNIPAYVVSGTPDEEIRYIVKFKSLDRYFKKVYGSPPSKRDILRAIISQEHFQAGNCLFLGDSLTDYHAAIETSVRFWGITSTEDQSPFPENTACFSTVPPILHYMRSTI